MCAVSRILSGYVRGAQVLASALLHPSPRTFSRIGYETVHRSTGDAILFPTATRWASESRLGCPQHRLGPPTYPGALMRSHIPTQLGGERAGPSIVRAKIDASTTALPSFRSTSQTLHQFCGGIFRPEIYYIQASQSHACVPRRFVLPRRRQHSVRTLASTARRPTTCPRYGR